MPLVNVIAPSGRTISVEESDLPRLEAQGYRRESAAEAHAAGVERVAEEQYGSGLANVRAGLEGAARGLTAGLSDVILGYDAEGLRERQERNPVISTGTEIAGAIAPAFFTGGAGALGAAARATPAGAIARVGAGLSHAAEGAGLATKVGRAALGGMTEGALFSAGHVLSETVLRDKELTAEAFLAGVGGGGLWGGAGGAAFGLLSAGTRAAKNKVDEITALRGQRAAEAEAKAAAKEAEKAQRSLERLRLEQARQENRVSLEQLRQSGRAASGEVRLAAADKALQREIAKAEANVISAKARAEQVGQALELEKSKFERAKMVMDGRLELADVYTSGWKSAREGKEAVAATELEAAGIAADANMRTGLAEALAKSGRRDRGYLIEELIPRKLRSPQAVEQAKSQVLNAAEQSAARADELVRQADELMELNPVLQPELRLLRDRAAEASPALREFAEREAAGMAPAGPQALELPSSLRNTIAERPARIGDGLEGTLQSVARSDSESLLPSFDPRPTPDGEILDRFFVRVMAPPGTPGVPKPYKVGKDGVRVETDTGEPTEIATAMFSIQPGRDGRPALYPDHVATMGPFQRRGIASEMYRHAEEATGLRIVPAHSQTEQGKALSDAFRARRDAGAIAPTDFHASAGAIQTAEEAAHDLAQAMRPHLDDIVGPQLDTAMAGMDDAVGKQDEIVADVTARRVEDLADTPAPPPAAERRGVVGTALGVLDTAAQLGGLPDTSDIPVIGPLMSAYLKYRAVKGALGRVGIQVGGPVGRIARAAAQTQDRIQDAAMAMVRGADKATKAAARVAPTTTSILSRPLWDPMEDEKPRRGAPEPTKQGPQELMRKREEEILRATSSPEEARLQVLRAIPAPPSVAGAIADAFMRRLGFLASQLPPDNSTPTTRQVPTAYSPTAIRRFSEAVAVVHDPVAAMERMAAGDVNPFAAEALRAVYPKLFGQLQEGIVEQISSGAVPSHAQKTAIGLVFDIPMDGTMTPDYRAARQMEYAMAAQAQPPPSGPTLKLSRQEELGAVRRAVR